MSYSLMYLVLPDMHSLSGISCHSICQFCYSKDYVYDHSFSKICNFLFLSLRSNSPHAMPDAMLYIHTAYHLTCFFISPPPVWAGICRTARQSCLIPYSSLSCCNIPRTPLRLPCSPAEVSLSPEFSRQNAAAAPCRKCRSYFSFFCCDSSFYLYKNTATCFSQANISPRSSPLIT